MQFLYKKKVTVIKFALMMLPPIEASLIFTEHKMVKLKTEYLEKKIKRYIRSTLLVLKGN